MASRRAMFGPPAPPPHWLHCVYVVAKWSLTESNDYIIQCTYQGRIQDFKLGGAHLKKLRRAEGGANIFGVFRVKKSRFCAKKSFFPILEP
jgi:hypothetical protein